MKQHDWIVHALDSMIQTAKGTGSMKLAEQLSEARNTALQELGPPHSKRNKFFDWRQPVTSMLRNLK